MSTNSTTKCNCVSGGCPRCMPSKTRRRNRRVRNNAQRNVPAQAAGPRLPKLTSGNVSRLQQQSIQQSAANRNIRLGPMELDYFRRSFGSKAEQSKHLEKVRTIVRAFLDPSSNQGFVLPLGSGEVSIYNSKQATELVGASDNSATPTLGASDIGKFAIFYSPVLTDAVGYDKLYPSSQLVVVDGGNRPVVWPNTLNTNTANSRIAYSRDANIDTFVRSDLQGTADKARVAGASILITFDGDNFGGGGRLVSRCMHGSSWPKRCTVTTQSATNSILNYDTFNSDIPHTYQGKLKKGTYIWWQPQSISDLEFRTVQDDQDSPGSTMATWSAPYLACAGFINQATAGTTGIAIKNSMMVQAYTNFNYTVDNRTQPGIAILDDEDAVQDAMRVLALLPTSWENNNHEKVISAILGALGGFVLARTGAGAILGALTGLGVNVGAVKSVVTAGK